MSAAARARAEAGAPGEAPAPRHGALPPAPSPLPLSLDEFVARAKDGDREAFSTLYRARLPAVARYVGAILRDPDQTEDVVAQTFVLAWTNLPRLRQVDRFDAWLFRIARNQARSELRQRPTAPLDEVPEPADESRFNSPAASLDTQSDSAAVRSALLKLSEDQREVLVLRFFWELSGPQIAAQLGKTEQAVWALQYRALKRMRALMAEWAQEAA